MAPRYTDLAGQSNEYEPPAEVSQYGYKAGHECRMKYFASIPWVREQGDVLLEEVFGDAPNLALLPLRFHPEDDEKWRRSVLDFAIQCPTAFARIFEHRLLSIKQPIQGLVLTLDWIGPMKVAAHVARMHRLPVVILPHEAVYLQEERFYFNPYDGTNIPTGDAFLAWGGLQKDHMLARGYPAERIKVVSSPKLQAAATYKPSMERAEYAHRLGLAPEKPIILFVAQNLDNCDDPDGARRRQVLALEDVVAVCEMNGFQLVVRLPPANISPIFENGLRDRFGDTPRFPVISFNSARAETYPREAITHSDCLVSISSTMLLEAALIGKPSLAIDYIAVPSLFVTRGGLPAADSRDALAAMLPKLVRTGQRSFPEEGWRQMERDFSSGRFDSQDATAEIRDFFESFTEPHFLGGRPALFSGSLQPCSSLLWGFHQLRKLPFGRTIARRIFKPVA